jgi:hypothetical protein
MQRNLENTQLTLILLIENKVVHIVEFDYISLTVYNLSLLKWYVTCHYSDL